MPGSPIANDGDTAAESEDDEFAPQLGRVATSLAPAAAEEALERIKDAVARRLLPERRLAELQPTTNGFSIGTDLAGDAADRRSEPVQPCGLLILRPAAGKRRCTRLLRSGRPGRRLRVADRDHGQFCGCQMRSNLLRSAAG